MALPTNIAGGEGNSCLASVSKDGALKVSSSPASAASLTSAELTRVKLFRNFLRDSGGSKDMNVNGSSTPQLFFHEAVPGVARWITSLRFIFNDTGLEIDTNDARDFGSAAGSGGLTNGLICYTEQGGIITNVFAEPVTRIIEFLNYADRFTNLKNSISTQSDFLSFDFDFTTPVAVPPSVTDKVVVVVQDDLRNLELFNVIIRGFQEIVTV